MENPGKMPIFDPDFLYTRQAHTMTESHLLSNADVSYLTPVLMPEGELIAVPAGIYENLPQHHLSIFCLNNGFYQLPTVELIEWLKDRIGGRKAIEIGAGNGVIGRALGIAMFDNYMQEWPFIIEHYKYFGQVPTKYGKDVIKMDGYDAVKQERPDVVIASWVTQRGDARQVQSNDFGVNEVGMMSYAKEYIHIGNIGSHAQKVILSNPHFEVEEVKLPGVLFSRSMTPANNIIYIVRHANTT